MKRSAQIILIVVSLLLTAILITSVIFSGTVAKYTTSASDTATARVKKFGVTAEVTPSEDFLDKKKPVILPGMGQIEVTFDDAEMEPGTDLSDAIKMHLYGKAETRVLVTIDFDIDFDESTFTYVAPPVDPEAPISVSQLFFPIDYVAAKAPKNGDLVPTTLTRSRNYDSKLKIDFAFCRAYANYLGMDIVSSPYERGGYAVGKIFEANEEITLAGYEADIGNTFQFGLKWDVVNDAEVNKIETWLAQNKELAASVKFNIKIEQISDSFVLTEVAGPG